MDQNMKKLFAFLCGIFVFISLVFAAQSAGAAGAARQDGQLKILAIGNSFSEDGIENYLYELAQASNKQIIIGNLYIGGASLELHVKNAIKDAATYDYRKIGLDGKKLKRKAVSIAEALAEEDWDYISFQQASSLSGQYDLIMQSLPELMKYVRERVAPKTQFVFHQTWAYQQDSKHAGFANYDRDQLKMYTAIAATSKQLFKAEDFKYLIPAGTAIQNARTSSIGDYFTRDGYHLQLDYGRFTAACTWYEKLFKLDVRKNSYKPDLVTAAQAKIAKEAAHQACKKPYKISRIKG